MKKRVIIGVLLIVLAIGGTIAMNVAGISKGMSYKCDYHTNRINNSSILFYDNTYTYKTEYEPNNYDSNPTPDIETGYYIKTGNEIEFLNNQNLRGKYRINPYQLVIGESKFVNKAAIWCQILFVIMLILGLIFLIKPRKANN